MAGVVARSTALRRLRTADTLEVADLSAGTVLYIREITLDSTVEQTYFLLQCHLPCFGQYMQQMARYLPASWAQIPVPVILQRNTCSAQAASRTSERLAIIRARTMLKITSGIEKRSIRLAAARIIIIVGKLPLL